MARKILLFLFLPLFATAQVETENEILRTVRTLFEGMRLGDSSMVRSTFHPSAGLQTTFMDKEGQPQFRLGDVDRFVTQMGTPHEGVYNEQIWDYQIQIDGTLAAVWTDYTFFVDDRFLHCGVNAFHLVQTNDGWKITNIIDTRRKTNCQLEATDRVQELNTFVNDWHQAAATANADAFFGAMTPDGIYIGTDATERWLRDELRDWAKAAFEREVAWDFKAVEREVYFSRDGRYAWWEESLDTWMGICRGSGVVEKQEGQWKIKHYHLSVTVPNEKIKEFKKLVGKE
ncbi:MAG: nuclear transport factor 2 family protein [Bacteroidota bacterium]